MLKEIILIIPILIYIDLLSEYLKFKGFFRKKYFFAAFLLVIAVIEIVCLPLYYVTRKYIVYKIIFYTILFSSTFYFFYIIGIKKYFKTIEKSKIIFFFVALFLIPFTIFGYDVGSYNALSMSSFQQGVILSHNVNHLYLSSNFPHNQDFFYLFTGMLYEFLGGGKESVFVVNMIFNIVLLDSAKFIVDSVYTKKNMKKYLIVIMFSIFMIFGEYNFRELFGTKLVYMLSLPVGMMLLFDIKKYLDIRYFIVILLSIMAFSYSGIYLNIILILIYGFRTRSYEKMIYLLCFQSIISILSLFSQNTFSIMLLANIIVILLFYIISKIKIAKFLFNYIINNINMLLLMELILILVICLLFDINIIENIKSSINFVIRKNALIIEIILSIIGLYMMREDEKFIVIKYYLLVVGLLFLIPINPDNTIINNLNVIVGRILIIFPTSILSVYFFSKNINYYIFIYVGYISLIQMSRLNYYHDIQKEQLDNDILTYTYDNIASEKIILVPFTDDDDINLQSSINEYTIFNTNISVINQNEVYEYEEIKNQITYDYEELYYLDKNNNISHLGHEVVYEDNNYYILK